MSKFSAHGQQVPTNAIVPTNILYDLPFTVPIFQRSTRTSCKRVPTLSFWEMHITAN
ncbi:hypothetical protein CA54_06600 [Symmachiella macrocystis]|uniref:Uncharacterized protein n=1 Tax=Symmachiella macrocystis TaxID=2527985 RepID=A0A5C6BIF6_9PLAN|nr:hypothetical protein CA54_06600 [Symmachiella macrocystis]